MGLGFSNPKLSLIKRWGRDVILYAVRKQRMGNEITERGCYLAGNKGSNQGRTLSNLHLGQNIKFAPPPYSGPNWIIFCNT